MNDRELKDAIRSAVDEDASRAPAFSAVRARTPRALVGVGRGVLLATAGAAAIVLAAVAIERERPTTRLVVPDAVAALEDWRPMTDMLLDASRGSVLDAGHLSASLLPAPPIELDLDSRKEIP